MPATDSPYEELFGEGFVGRPLAEEPSTGAPSGNPQITEKARRRAARVLRTRHASEFERIMSAEVEYLQNQNKGA
jgi:hypothetical protein